MDITEKIEEYRQKISIADKLQKELTALTELSTKTVGLLKTPNDYTINITGLDMGLIQAIVDTGCRELIAEKSDELREMFANDDDY